MSVQFGRWSFDGGAPPSDFLERVNTILAPYGPDSSNFYQHEGVNILYRAFHTTSESCGEIQPHILSSGTVITWDGRLDNRADLLHQFHGSLSADPSDLAIVSTGYECSGTECFSKLIGDWALSIWNPTERSLVLAKDPIGTRHLYYAAETDRVSWSTVLDPLVLFAGRAFTLDEEYVAGWLSAFPAAHLTPYVGIESVPPSCFVRLRPGHKTIQKYWDFDPGKRIRYRTDNEYEEHFRIAFGEAVRQRLRCDTPILAELSGGVDSSSIVCMADRIMAREVVQTPRLDTVSYYNDSEPNWNERPYFTKVEQRRGRVGCHINLATEGAFRFETEAQHFAATPGAAGSNSTEAGREFAKRLAAQANRVVLSGIGGDEVTGGIATPKSELMDLLASARWGEFARRLKVWALNKRRPWVYLLFEAAQEFFPSVLRSVAEHNRPAHWLQPDFVVRERAALMGYPSRVTFFGSRPSFQQNLSALGVLRRQLAASASARSPAYEKRYPFLDRNLLEFLYAIPREQHVRPGERRSLMRRALRGIVPNELLDRRRKAFIARSPLAGISAEWASLAMVSDKMASASQGIAQTERFRDAVQKARNGCDVRIVPMLRTLEIEFWLRSAGTWGVLTRNPTRDPACRHRSTKRTPRPGSRDRETSAS